MRSSSAMILSCALLLATFAHGTEVEELIAAVKVGPGKPDRTPFLQAARALQEKMKDPAARITATKKQLLVLARDSDSAIQNAAFDALMQFKGDADIRALFIESLHNHPKPMTRGVMTGRLMVNTNRDPAIFAELRKALADESEFVRVRAAQDLGRHGDYSGLDIMKKILSETPVHDPNPKIGSQDSDMRIGTAARAAGEILHPDLLPMLRKLSAMGKAAPSSSGEATRSMWLLEIKLLPTQDKKIGRLREIAQQEIGIYWIDRNLVYKLDDLKLSKDDVVSVLNEAAGSKEFYTAHAAKEAIRRYEALSKKP